MTSSVIFSATPSSNTTLLKGRFRLGWPNGFHSMPHGMLMTSLPSWPRNAMSRASESNSVNTARSRNRVVIVMVSQGMPVMRLGDFVSRSRLIYATFSTSLVRNMRVYQLTCIQTFR